MEGLIIAKDQSSVQNNLHNSQEMTFDFVCLYVGNSRNRSENK